MRPQTVDVRALEGLPAPVGRYLRAVLKAGQPMVSGVRVWHTGIFNVDEGAEGELMRFFAEATWYPAALLPSRGVRWDAVDDRSAYATLGEGDHTITMLFTFDERGLIGTVHAELRGRAVGDEIVPTPWQGRFWNYE